MASPFANVGLSQFGQDANIGGGGDGAGIGNFLAAYMLDKTGAQDLLNSKGFKYENGKMSKYTAPVVPVDQTNPVFQTPAQNGFMPGGSMPPPTTPVAAATPIVPVNAQSAISPNQAFVTTYPPISTAPVGQEAMTEGNVNDPSQAGKSLLDLGKKFLLGT